MFDDTTLTAFQATVWNYYHDYGRHDLPWRLPESDGSFDPYKIMVSELMLQQTQVARVIPKYQEFLKQFPTVGSLAQVPLAAVLRAWNGLGYNRRAKFLHQAAQAIMHDYKGTFPETVAKLVTLPGIGINTAGAIVAYTFNQPASFIETNVRTVYIYHFFKDQTAVPDKEILALIEQTLPEKGAYREWYWALMDYGSYLKQTVGNLGRYSSSYAKQSKFEGSKRQIRGQVLRLLGDETYSKAELHAHIQDDRLATVLNDLLSEGLIRRRGERLSL